MTSASSEKHLVNGKWTAAGAAAAVDAAAQAAEEAFWSFGFAPRAERAALLNAAADEIEARAEDITKVGMAETGLPEARLQGERARTTGQLRLFAQLIEKGDYLDRRYDEEMPDRAPLARPNLRMMQRPIGPVAVFGASNFPLAFSTAGGDTAAALAAGCPVVVKGHPAHPGTGETVAQAIDAAVKKTGAAAGVFSFLQGGENELGQALVRHPLIKAVGFTGGLRGGRALFDMCAQRPEPITFFGEFGSVNPMFVLPAAAAARGGEIGKGWAASLTMGAGQFCTNPGIVVMTEDSAEAFINGSAEALAETGAQAMLTGAIADTYREGCARMAGGKGVSSVFTSDSKPGTARPNLFKVSVSDWLAAPDLAEEVFGPMGLVVTARSLDEMAEAAGALEGQLTCTLHMDAADTDAARRLVPVLERKAGRILANGFPTGVEVCDAMIHGGPYPASSNFGATSVGTLSIRRFLRPVCYQNMPPELLPEDLQNPAA